MYGLLANAGRREDNAALGGQVAHISAAEADLLRRLGGAGSVNPTTGLPEYYGVPGGIGPGSSSSPGSSGPGPMGITGHAVAQGLAALGLGTGSAAPGSTGTGSSVTPANTTKGNQGDGGTNQGLSFSPLANSTYGRAANMANANIAADAGLTPGMSVFGQLGHVLGKATTTGILGFLGDSGALGPAVQAMVRGTTTPTYGGEGSSSAGTSQGNSGQTSQGNSGQNTAVIGGSLDTGLQVVGTGLPQNVTQPGISIV